MPRKYLFIDAGFLQGFLKRMKQRGIDEFPFINDLTVSYERIGAGFDRVFFYDAYPARKESQTSAQYEAEYATKEALFNQISRERNYSVRTALTKNRARGKREQKGVDVLLAIDVLSHAVRGNIDEATIMTSDTDFFPLFEALLQTKTKSVLRYDVSRTSIELINSADFSQPVTAADFVGWHSADTRMQHSTSYLDRGVVEGGNEIANGIVDGKSLRLISVDDRHNYAALIDGEPRAQTATSRFLLEGLIEKQFAASVIYDQSDDAIAIAAD